MLIINTSSQIPSTTLGSLALYSGMDVLSLYEIQEGISKLMDSTRWEIYRFEMELQSPLLAMSLAGIPVNEAARREMIVEFTKEQSRLTTIINSMLEAIGYFEYYIKMAVFEFESQVEPISPLPYSWIEWKELPVSIRRAYKQASPEALAVYQKALKEFSSPFNPISPAQKLRLFYHFFGSPDNTIAEPYFFSPPWLKTYGIKEYKTRNTKNEYTPAADRAALEKIIKADHDERYASYWAAPFAHVCLAISDISKSLGFLNCKLEHGLFKSSFGAVTETGRLASRQNAQGYGSNAQNVSPKLRHIFVSPPGEKFIVVDYAQIESRIVAAICYRLFGATNYLAMTECLTGDHEVLTPNGWVKICEKPDIIACWSIQDQSINFASPLRWVEYETQETMTIQTKCFSLTATPNHVLPYKTRSGNFTLNKQSMKKAYTKTQFHVQLSGNYSGAIDINPIHAQLLAAYQADGYLSNRCVIEFSFAKERKINRLHTLLQKANIMYTTNWFPGYSGKAPTTRFYIKYEDWPITLRKHADNYLLDWVHSALKAYILEHEYWDGNRERNLSYRVTNKNKSHLEWIATIAHLVGMSATAPIPDHESWRISIRDSKITNIGTESGTRYTSNKPSVVYCPTVHTGFFLVRKDGFISVTGNCGDAHSLCASMVWDNLPWPQDFTLDYAIKHGPFPKDMLKAAKKLASEEFYRGKSRRDVSKTLGHGSNYCGKPPQMSKHSHIDIKLIEHYQSVYFAVCPELTQWHRWVVEQVQTTGEITTMLGRTRRFFNRPNDDATIREAVAYEPQSVAADYCNRALLRLHKLALVGAFPATIRLSKHDELVVSCKEFLEKEVLDKMILTMEEHILITSPAGLERDWYVPAEAESGWNLGRKSDNNPNGVSHPLDGRTRVNVGSWENWKF